MTETAPRPWDADRELTQPMAAAAIAEAVPSLAGREVRLLGSGWDFDAYEVEAEWVFKFPRRAKEVERLEREIAVLDVLEGAFELPIPRYAWPLLFAEAFPYAFSGYTKLAGRNLMGLAATAERIESLAEPVARLFGRLHAVSVAPLAAHLAEPVSSAEVIAESRERRRHVLGSLPACAPPDLVERANVWWDDRGALPAAYAGPPRLLHRDLHAEHLLVDEATGLCPVGVIDWGDVALGDPAGDFAPLVPWGGLPWLDAIVAAYPGDRAGLIERARFFATQLCVLEVDYFHRSDQPIERAEALRLLETLVP